MQDPAEDLPDLIHALTHSSSPTRQQNSIRSVFTPDASFNHPLCRVKSGHNSRDLIIGVYGWYRILSPFIKADVGNVVWDKPSGTAYVELTQVFHVFVFPWKPAPASLVVRLTLEQGITSETSKLYYISSQTDFYQPEGITNLILPFLTPLVLFFKLIASAVSVLSYVMFRSTFGWWDPALEARGKADKKAEINGVLRGVSRGDRFWLGLGKHGMAGWDKNKIELQPDFGHA
ncbi:hypothetical protein [Phaffia rhodozyma]|uniref:SigF-like NTF2-like domain-containing protein n=1 Tax=Phaffia rhodozyma TaxID=264483 RepID=A0A0F7SP52_PHARH|nr:hypothetical protein [Phaffia rhodozyma]